MTSAEISRCVACQHEEFEPVFRKEGYKLMRCRGCGLTFIQNPPDESALQELYSFDTGYHEDLESSNETSAYHLRNAKAHLRYLERYRQTGSLLDIGCSAGFFLEQARQKGFQVQGVEYSADSAAVAQEKGLDVFVGTLEAFNTEQRFDVITLWDVIEHVRDPLETLRIAKSLLSPEGYLFLETPNIDGLFPKASYQLAERLDFWPHPEPPGHLFQFSGATITDILSKAGFETEKVLHRRIPVSYSFGSFKEVFRSVKWLVYSAAFIPMSVVGPWIKSGDSIVVVAKPSKSS